MTARFYGSVENESHVMGENDDIAQISESHQEYNSTMLVCYEINKEVKNLRMEVASLKTTLEEVKLGNKGANRAPIKASGKLPEGLLVRQSMDR